MLATPSQNNIWPEQTPIPESSPRLAKRRRTLQAPTRGSTSKMARQIVTDSAAVREFSSHPPLLLPYLIHSQKPQRPTARSTRATTLCLVSPLPTPLYPSTNGQRLSVRMRPCPQATSPHLVICRELQSPGFHSDGPGQYIPVSWRLATTNPLFRKRRKSHRTGRLGHGPGQ